MQQKAIGLALALLFASGLFADPSRAQSGALVVPVCGTLPLAYKTGSTRPLTQDVNGNMCSSATAGALTGSTSNATSAVATTATNIPTVSYNYGFNGTTWDQLQVDGSKNLQVNCAVGCSGGSFNNNSDGVATSSTNGQAAGWIYVWNGATWDRAIGTAALGQYVQAKSGAFASGSIASGAIVDLGAQADAAWSSGSGSLIAISKTIATNSGAAVPCFYSTAYNTLSQVNGTTAPAGCDLNGNLYVNLGRYMGTAGTANSAVMSVQGIASMTPFLTTTTLNAETTKVIGTVNQGTSPWVVSNGGTFAVQSASTLAAETTKVIGTVRVQGNVGGAFDGATGAAAPANGVQVTAKASGATGGYSAGLIQCDQHTFKHITSATDTLAIQGVASQTIYFCGWRARAAGVATWYFEDEADANANCSNLGSQLTGIATEAANTGEVAMSPFFNGFKGASGHGICIKSTGTGGVDIDYWYTQF